jgi:hypothetical protein
MVARQSLHTRLQSARWRSGTTRQRISVSTSSGRSIDDAGAAAAAAGMRRVVLFFLLSGWDGQTCSNEGPFGFKAEQASLFFLMNFVSNSKTEFQLGLPGIYMLPSQKSTFKIVKNSENNIYVYISTVYVRTSKSFMKNGYFCPIH